MTNDNELYNTFRERAESKTGKRLLYMHEVRNLADRLSPLIEDTHVANSRTVFLDGVTLLLGTGIDLSEVGLDFKHFGLKDKSLYDSTRVFRYFEMLARDGKLDLKRFISINEFLEAGYHEQQFAPVLSDRISEVYT